MTYSTTRVENTIPIGGNLKMRVEELDISNYDDTGDASGEAFVPADVNMRRFVCVLALEVSGDAQWAKYDEANSAIRLYDSAGEIGSNANNTGTVKAVCVGV